ncbi:MAG: TolC family protein [Deltaproteobacteria bacterium]|nr:TolC family protein [Deltaproteobacteria bacterium]
MFLRNTPMSVSKIFLIVFYLNIFILFSPPGSGAGDHAGEKPIDRDLSEAHGVAGISGKRDVKTIPFRLSVQEAVLMALENNRALDVERFNPAIQKTYEDQELAVFDPKIKAGVSISREEDHPLGQLLTSSSGSSAKDVDLSVSEFLPYGTDISIGIDAGRTSSDRFERRYESRAGLSITQALLKGRGTDENLATLRQARLNTSFSEFELRGFTEALVSDVETSYWEYLLASYRIGIYEKSLKLAEQQLDETREIVNVGRLAETEMVAAQAEVSLRRQELIDAQNVMAAARLRLIRLLNPDVPDFWDREIILTDKPFLPYGQPDRLADHIDLAMRIRPDMNQARLAIQRQELELVKTKNGILPRMDLFISLGKTGYSTSFGDSLGNMSGDTYDLMAGIRAELPFHNRDSNARHRRALLTKSRAQEALSNLSQLVELDVRMGYIEVNRARQQIAASTATREIEEEKVRIETEKFRVGKSTSFLVAQAQRDLVRSQINEINATIGNLKALVNLYRLDGSLLERRGIEAPGKEPVEGY